MTGRIGIYGTVLVESVAALSTMQDGLNGRQSDGLVGYGNALAPDFGRGCPVT
jgi:hypothetical protein